MKGGEEEEEEEKQEEHGTGTVCARLEDERKRKGPGLEDKEYA